MVLGEIGDFGGRCLSERFLGPDGFRELDVLILGGGRGRAGCWGERRRGGKSQRAQRRLSLSPPPPAAPGKRKRKAAAAAGRATLCGECGEGTRDRAGWLRCGECNTAAHRFCLGLGASSQLGNRYVCCQCEAWRAWEGGGGGTGGGARDQG